MLFFCKRCKWPAWGESQREGVFGSPTSFGVLTYSLQKLRGRTISIVILPETKARGGQPVPRPPSGSGRTGRQGDLFGFALERVSARPSRPRRGRPGAPWGGGGWAAAVASASGAVGREVRRPARRPGSLPPAARSLPAPPAAGRRPQRGRAGHVGASVTPSLTPSPSHTHTHTRAHAPARLHLVLFHRPTHGRSRVSPCQPAGSDPLIPAPAPARGKELRLPSAPRSPAKPPGPDPLATAATAGTWRQQKAPGGDTRTVMSHSCC